MKPDEYETYRLVNGIATYFRITHIETKLYVEGSYEHGKEMGMKIERRLIGELNEKVRRKNES